MSDVEAEADRIIGLTDYYEILGLKKRCPKRDFIRKFRKFNMLFSKQVCEKNPRAKEAMEIVFTAYECLTDHQSRKVYDATGKDPSGVKIIKVKKVVEVLENENGEYEGEGKLLSEHVSEEKVTPEEFEKRKKDAEEKEKKKRKPKNRILM